MTIVASNNITVSNVNDGTITHTAYAYSADGTDRFTNVYPNLNLLDGTKDFSGTWTNLDSNKWITDGTYKNLVVKKRTTQWRGLYKTFTAPKDGVYTFSAYVKSSGNMANISRYCGLNSTNANTSDRRIGNNFDWIIDTITFNLKANDNVWVRYEITESGTDSILWTAGHKWELSSTATPWMPSSSEAKTSDYPSYIGQYSDFSSTASTDPAKYAPWTIFKGNDGIGIKTTDITYAISTSGTTAPSTGWTSSVPSLVKGQYLWTKTVLTYTDNSSKTWYSVTYNSKDGTNGTNGTSGIIVSSVAPASPQTGQLWQDTSTTPQLVKKWTGSEWVIWAFYAQNLKADSLETVSAIIGKIINNYTVDYGTGVHTGTVTIENGIKIVDDVGVSRTITDFTSQSSGQGMFARYLPNKSDSTKYQQAWYTPFSLRFDDTVNDWHGQITAENVTLVPWTNLTYSAGYTTAEDNPCQYRKIKNLDGSYTVQFRGQVKPTSGSFPTTNFQFIAPLPTDIRPIKNSFAMAVGDVVGAQTIRIGALMDGRIQIGARGTATAYIAIDALTYII